MLSLHYNDLMFKVEKKRKKDYGVTENKWSEHEWNIKRACRKCRKNKYKYNNRATQKKCVKNMNA